MRILNELEGFLEFYQEFTCKCNSHIDLVNGFAMHYYCGTAGNAIEYTSDQWYELLDKALYIETLIVQHRKIMDSLILYEKLISFVDEWGTWASCYTRLFLQSGYCNKILFEMP